MALKFKITKEDHEALDEAMRAFYKADGDAFVLDVDGAPEPKGDDDLEARLKKLEANNASLLEEKRAAAEEARKAREEAARKSGDTEALEASWREKVEAAKAEAAAEIQKRDAAISNLTVGSTATSLAAELFGEHAELMMPHVQGRLTHEMGDDGMPRVRVLGPDGKPSASSVDDLKKEIQNAPRFAPFVIGSKASGPGARPAGSGGATTKKFGEMNGEELVKLRRENPAEYNRLRDDHKAAADA